MRTTSGPACRKSCLPILKMPTSRRQQRRPGCSASDRRSTSSATMRRCAQACRWRAGSPAATHAARPTQRRDPCDDLARPAPRSPRLAARGFSSTQPRASARGPTVTRTGMPIRSASLNFTPGPLVAIVEQRVDARAPRARRAMRSAVSRSAASLDVDRHDVRAERRERRRPDDAVVVVVLLDRRGDRARDADAVAAHLDRRAPGRRRRGTSPSWPREYFVPR